MHHKYRCSYKALVQAALFSVGVVIIPVIIIVCQEPLYAEEKPNNTYNKDKDSHHWMIHDDALNGPQFVVQVSGHPLNDILRVLRLHFAVHCSL